MATYNGSKYIEKQLETLLEQTKQPDEVIICDDVSTDNTAELVLNFIEKHDLKQTWHFSINEKNLGYRKNFYNALTKATGDHIFLSDQDDEWYPEKIEKMHQIMQTNAKVKALNCAVSLIDGKSEPIAVAKQASYYNAGFIYSRKPLAKLTSFSANAIMRNNISPGCTMAIKKELRDKLSELYQAEMPHDWYLNLMAALEHGCFFLNEQLTGYRLHENNTLGASTDNRWTKILARFDMSEKIAEQQGNLVALNNLGKALSQVEPSEVAYLNEYYTTRVNFYQRPSLKRLSKLKKYPEYKQDSKMRGRLWDQALAVHLEKVIAKLASN